MQRTCRNSILDKSLASCGYTRLLAVRLLVCVVATAGTLTAQQAASSSKSAALLYVIDSDNLHRASRVLAVDPQRKVIVKTYRADYHPDIAVSPDGKRLYLSYDTFSADGNVRTGTLQVIDTATGAVVASVSNPGRVYTNDDDTVSYMALSADGRWLYVFKDGDRSDDSVSYVVAVFDTTINSFLPDMVALPDCDFSRLLPWPGSSTLSVVCGGTRELRTVKFSDTGVPSTRLPIGISIVQPNKPVGVGIATAFLSGENQLTIVFGDGNYSRVSLTTGKVVQQGLLVFSPPLNLQLTLAGSTWQRSGRFVAVFKTPVWSGKVFLVLAKLPDYNTSGLADAIAVLDGSTLQQEGFIVPENPFADVGVGTDGTLFVVDPKDTMISMRSVPDGAEKGRITGVGTDPTFVVASH
jgi:hypothetical protein